MYAHVTGSTVDQVGGLPDKVYENERWYDLRTKDPATLAEVGWYVVKEVARPADTAETTYSDTYTFDGVGVNQSWNPVSKTDEQLARDAAIQAQYDYDVAVATSAAPTELAALQNANLAAAGIASGDAWRRPSGAHDAYPLDWTVEWTGKTWKSLVAANVWEPGVSSWLELAENGCPDFVQPTGAQDAYPIGACVTFQGQQYTSLIAANVWSPADYPAGWQLV